MMVGIASVEYDDIDPSTYEGITLRLDMSDKPIRFYTGDAVQDWKDINEAALLLHQRGIIET